MLRGVVRHPLSDDHSRAAAATEPVVTLITDALLDPDQQVLGRRPVEGDREFIYEGIQLRITDVGVVAVPAGAVVTLQGRDGIATEGNGPVADDADVPVAALHLGGGVGNLPDGDPDAVFLELGLQGQGEGVGIGLLRIGQQFEGDRFPAAQQPAIVGPGGTRLTEQLLRLCHIGLPDVDGIGELRVVEGTDGFVEALHHIGGEGLVVDETQQGAPHLGLGEHRLGDIHGEAEAGAAGFTQAELRPGVALQALGLLGGWVERDVHLPVLDGLDPGPCVGDEEHLDPTQPRGTVPVVGIGGHHQFLVTQGDRNVGTGVDLGVDEFLWIVAGALVARQIEDGEAGLVGQDVAQPGCGSLGGQQQGLVLVNDDGGSGELLRDGLVVGQMPGHEGRQLLSAQRVAVLEGDALLEAEPPGPIALVDGVLQQPVGGVAIGLGTQQQLGVAELVAPEAGLERDEVLDGESGGEFEDCLGVGAGCAGSGLLRLLEGTSGGDGDSCRGQSGTEQIAAG